MTCTHVWAGAAYGRYSHWGSRWTPSRPVFTFSASATPLTDNDLLLARFEMTPVRDFCTNDGNALLLLLPVDAFNLNGAQIRPASTKAGKLIYGAAAAMPGTFLHFCQRFSRQLVLTAD